MSMFTRVLRPVTLLVAGMLLAQATLSVAAPTTAATTYTRAVSCAGLDFHPIDSRTQYRWEGRLLYRTTQGGDGWFLCDPNLPNKAKVTRVRFTVKDSTDLQSVTYCALSRGSLATSGSVDVMADITGTGMAATPGVVRRSDTTISHATIDQTKYAYWLQCQIVWHPSLSSTAANAGIIGADVTYTISSTNG
jgi:hypothetical protein